MEAMLAEAPLRASALKDQMVGLVCASLVSSTWAKYEAGWAAFDNFQQQGGKKFTWPLADETIRDFAIWCVSVKNLQPGTASTYLQALSMAHKLKGLGKMGGMKDELLNLILKGAERDPSKQGFVQEKVGRRVVSLPLLKVLGHKLSKSGWDSTTIQTIWAACTVAFFTSARMGELLAPSEASFDPTTTLTWQDVKFRKDGSILIHIKNPKSGTKGGEFLDIFGFPGFGCCPAQALSKHRDLQEAAGLAHSWGPVFRLADGKNLSGPQLNKSLKSLLTGVLDYKKDGVFCHSFRASVASTLARFPDLASSEEVKGWGRWDSSCYLRYSRLKLDRKRQIFGKIAHALRQ